MHYSIVTDEGQPITTSLVETFIQEIITEEMEKGRESNEKREQHERRDTVQEGGHLRSSGLITLSIVSAKKFLDFLPTVLYPLITTHHLQSRL